jgi:hypothetical protein
MWMESRKKPGCFRRGSWVSRWLPGAPLDGDAIRARELEGRTGFCRPGGGVAVAGAGAARLGGAVGSLGSQVDIAGHGAAAPADCGRPDFAGAAGVHSAFHQQRACGARWLRVFSAPGGGSPEHYARGDRAALGSRPGPWNRPAALPVPPADDLLPRRIVAPAGVRFRHRHEPGLRRGGAAFGGGMFLLARLYFGDAGGWLGAAAYLYAPYFAVDLYVRSAMEEFAAFPFSRWPCTDSERMPGTASSNIG